MIVAKFDKINFCLTCFYCIVSACLSVKSSGKKILPAKKKLPFRKSDHISCPQVSTQRIFRVHLANIWVMRVHLSNDSEDNAVECSAVHCSPLH